MINWLMFEQLTQAPGAPGFEGEVRRIMHTYMKPHAEEIIQDRLGGIFAKKVGNVEGPKVLVAGHMDEVAFMVTNITEQGFIKFQPLGGWWSQVLLSQRVDIYTDEGKSITGMIGSLPPHLLNPEKRNKPVKITEMFIDIGAESKEQVEAWGVQLGDPIIPYGPFTEMEGGKRLMSKAWDNRLGCGLALEALNGLQDEYHPNILYAGATVQEEVGLRGAAATANLIQPDIFFGIDVGPAGDTPGVRDGFGKIGKGVLIRLVDRSMITHPGMREFLIETAESENIPYQFFVSQGGTDAGRVHQSGDGVLSAAIGVCGRYIHSHLSIVDKEDVEAAKAFTIALIKRLDQSTYQKILGK
ncbi:M42 family metallopeptidase [Thermoflavimicrobium daqui]|uniref:Peptidase M28 n=1 Tax=Thermoflavimicrobium daqui TaxID=2137476 RepID=A0A364K2D7_9BACL|nr:M42 family metallopeptidase [Thermoflavimicrobium daqui]RAL22594.1 peptidase M28 [Thermoflavimicrobium daqui]